MDDDRAPVGLLIAALGAAALAISVFLPWYGVSITASGAVAAQQELATVAREYGNPRLRAEANAITPQFSSLAGRQLMTVTARQALKRESTLLLALAGIALLASLLRLADMRGLMHARGSQIALLGGLAGAIVFFRLLVRPGSGTDFISLSVGWGLWLALLSSVAIVGGALVAGSDRVSTRARTKHGPGPPPLGLGLSQRPNGRQRAG